VLKGVSWEGLYGGFEDMLLACGTRQGKGEGIGVMTVLLIFSEAGAGRVASWFIRKYI
jgi:hypothetical protein